MPRAAKPLADADEARINRGIAADPDNPEWTEDDFRQARPATEALPPGLAAELRRHRGPQRSPTKVPVSLRLDQDVLERLRATGPGWQGRANDLLRKGVLGK